MEGRSAPAQVQPVSKVGAATTAKPVVWSVAVTILAVAADVSTKAWALSRLSGGRAITLPGGLIRLQLVINHGAAFGLGASYEPLLVGIAFAGVILLGVWAVRARGRGEGLGAALAAAGAAGNLIDRLIRPPAVMHGGVVDWLHISFYAPTFNLADIWLRGGLLIAVGGWLWERRTRSGDTPLGVPRSVQQP